MAGLTPRDRNTKSQRTTAYKRLNELGFDGAAYVSEYSTWKTKADYVERAIWEREALANSTVIMFWIPRSLPDILTFTANVEFGYRLHSGKIIYSRLTDAKKQNERRIAYGQ